MENRSRTCIWGAVNAKLSDDANVFFNHWNDAGWNSFVKNGCHQLWKVSNQNKLTCLGVNCLLGWLKSQMDTKWPFYCFFSLSLTKGGNWWDTKTESGHGKVDGNLAKHPHRRKQTQDLKIRHQYSNLKFRLSFTLSTFWGKVDFTKYVVDYFAI